MNKLILVALSVLTIGLQNVYSQSDSNPISVIYDTDMGPMIDDVAGIAMLHAFADKGEAEILATIASNRHSNVAQVIDVFNTYYGRTKIPLGVPRGPAVESLDFGSMMGGWTNYIVQNYPSTVRSNEVAYDAVDLYRKILSEQENKSVTTITVGFLTNIADLLASGPDEHSNLNGIELVEQKVNRLVAMAGTFPSGYEYNLYKDTRASKIAFQYWPTEIIFSGFEIGREVRTGMPLINNTDIKNSPIRETFRMKLDDDRSSFDQTAVLVAVRGAAPFYELKPGRITVDIDGQNGWDESGSGHYYLIEKMDPEDVAEIINDLIQHEPKLR